MKRTIEGRELESMSMADCLMLLSRGRHLESMLLMSAADNSSPSPTRVFECKTCNRQFPSFQALGGHRASHKKPKIAAGDHPDLSPAKPKTHECAICGLEFAIGQALGGHMRRHRGAAAPLGDEGDVGNVSRRDTVVVKNSSGRRVLCLDLNLTPTENDLEFGLGMKAPPSILL